MKRYFLHSVVWVQIVILSIVTLFTLGRNYIDSFVFNFVHFYPFESMINGVINIFYNDILFFSIILPFFLKYFLSILPLLLLIVCFLSFYCRGVYRSEIRIILLSMSKSYVWDCSVGY